VSRVRLILFGVLSLLVAAVSAEAQTLTSADVQQVIAQAVAESQARGVASTIAVTDRVGNVLAVFQMNGAANLATITSAPRPVGTPTAIAGAAITSLEGIAVTSTLAAIAKAITGAYLSSGGNAFTTRTASQIIQDHFNPGETFSPSGPLFGVQFSQLPCSDLNVRFFDGGAGGLVNATIGPKRSPLGLSADAGGLPLYKNGIHSGGIGVMSDGVYGLDLVITNVDLDQDEIIALAGQTGFVPAEEIKAYRIGVIGKSLRYVDAQPGNLAANPANAAAFGGLIGGAAGNLVAVLGYYAIPNGGTAADVLAGQTFGQPASGIRSDAGATFGTFRNGQSASILVNGANANRFAPRAGTDGLLTQAEVTTLMIAALNVGFNARAQIRKPFGENMNFTVSIVDTNGAILAIARTPDGPIFGIDVSLQKARTAALFSNFSAGSDLTTAGFGDRVTAVRTFFGDPTALNNGTAFADRSGGNLSRPWYPDGFDGSENGPLSNPHSTWSPFATGLQFELVANNLVQHLTFIGGLGGVPSGADTPARCSALPLQIATGSNRLANGLQIFPGSVPLFRANVLVGGMGVSGDGVDQDDMVSFLGTHNGSVALATGVGNAPKSIRADNLVPKGVRLRYVNCPFAPFLDTSAQNVCAGK